MATLVNWLRGVTPASGNAEEEFTLLRAQIDRLKATNEKFSASVGFLRGRISRRDATIQELRWSIEELDKKCKTQYRDLGQYKNLYSEILGKQRNLQGRISQLEQDLNDEKIENTNNKRLIETTKQSCAAIALSIAVITTGYLGIRAFRSR